MIGKHCEHGQCGHEIGHHEASGPCLVTGCPCPGFTVLSRADREARKLTRCSGCGRRVRAGSNPHGSALDTFGQRMPGMPCPRKGLGPDRAEGWRP